MSTYIGSTQILDINSNKNAWFQGYESIDNETADPIFTTDLYDQIKAAINVINSREITLETDVGTTAIAFYKEKIDAIPGAYFCARFYMYVGSSNNSTKKYARFHLRTAISSVDLTSEEMDAKLGTKSAGFCELPGINGTGFPSTYLYGLPVREITSDGTDTKRNIDSFDIKSIPISVYIVRFKNCKLSVSSSTVYDYYYMFIASSGWINDSEFNNFVCNETDIGNKVLIGGGGGLTKSIEIASKNYGRYTMNDANNNNTSTTNPQVSKWSFYNGLNGNTTRFDAVKGTVLGDLLYSLTTDYQGEDIVPSNFGNESTQINYGSDPENVPSFKQPLVETPSYNYNGVCTVLVPTEMQFMNSIAYLQNNVDFTDDPTYNKVLQLLLDTWGNAMDYIIDVHYIPFSVDKGTNVRMEIGGYKTLVGGYQATDVIERAVYSSDLATSGNVIPKLYIPAKTGSYLDYEPYTSMMIYIPFIGYHNIRPSDVVGKYIVLDYIIDIVTGDFVVYLRADDTKTATTGQYIGEFQGNMAMHVQITSKDYTSVISNLTGGLISGTNNATNIGTSLGSTKGGLQGLGIGTFGAMGFSVLSAMPGAVSAATGASQPDVERGGSLTGSICMMTERRPYVIINSPVMFNPEEKATVVGNPVYFKGKLSKSVGVTKVLDGHLENMSCLETECEQIMNILKEGIII